MSMTSALATAVNVFASPGEAFRTIRERPTFLAPWLLICIATAAVNWFYISEVDLGWLIEQQLRAQTFIELTDAQIEDRVNAVADGGRGALIAQGVLGSFLVITLLMLIQAAYLKIVSAFRKDGVRYKQWFSLVAWTSLPVLLTSIATIIFVLTSDVRFVAQTGINPLSFANLLQIDMSEAGTGLSIALGLSPINIWSLILVIFGYRVLADSGLGSSIAVVLGPVILVAAIVTAIFI